MMRELMMKSTSKFVQLSSIDPEAAKRLAPGVTMLVSRRTFAEIAHEKRQQDLAAKQRLDDTEIWVPEPA